MPDSIHAGEVLASRYRLDDLLAESEGGRFWRAHDPVLHRHVAVHLIPRDDPRADGLLEAARNVAPHLDPRLLRVLDAERLDDLCFVVNEWGQGTSLDVMLANDGPLQPRRAAWIVSEVADSLALAHDAGLGARTAGPRERPGRPPRTGPDHRLRRRRRPPRPAARSTVGRPRRHRRPAVRRPHRQVGGRLLLAAPRRAHRPRRRAATAAGPGRHPARPRRPLRPGHQLRPVRRRRCVRRGHRRDAARLRRRRLRHARSPPRTTPRSRRGRPRQPERRPGPRGRAGRRTRRIRADATRAVPSVTEPTRVVAPVPADRDADSDADTDADVPTSRPTTPASRPRGSRGPADPGRHAGLRRRARRDRLGGRPAATRRPRRRPSRSGRPSRSSPPSRPRASRRRPAPRRRRRRHVQRLLAVGVGTSAAAAPARTPGAGAGRPLRHRHRRRRRPGPQLDPARAAHRPVPARRSGRPRGVPARSRQRRGVHHRAPRHAGDHRAPDALPRGDGSRLRPAGHRTGRWRTPTSCRWRSTATPPRRGTRRATTSSSARPVSRPASAWSSTSAAPAASAQVDIATLGGPTSLAVYVTGQAPTGVADLTPVGTATGSGTLTVELDEAVSGRFVTVWLTALPQLDGTFRGTIADVVVAG